MVIRGARKKSTAILSHLYKGKHKPSKQAEKVSYHLGRIDIKEIVENKALKLAKLKIKESKEKVNINYDGSDIYKPDAKKCHD